MVVLSEQIRLTKGLVWASFNSSKFRPCKSYARAEKKVPAEKPAGKIRNAAVLGLQSRLLFPGMRHPERRSSAE
jgi:hypothetical protein